MPLAFICGLSGTQTIPPEIAAVPPSLAPFSIIVTFAPLSLRCQCRGQAGSAGSNDQDICVERIGHDVSTLPWGLKIANGCTSKCEDYMFSCYKRYGEVLPRSPSSAFAAPHECFTHRSQLKAT